jgi:hypothetical protein
VLAAVADGTAAGRLRLSSYRRVYAAAAALLAVVIAYLAVSAQVTQTSYDLDRLRDQRTQLVAEQDDLRAQDARMHTQAGVSQAAASLGMQHGNRLQYVRSQPVALDLGAPIGPARPDDSPLWQRALAAVFGGTARDAQAARS